jgi:predicted Fe-Mo cluster-binding NifX family protein
MKIAVVTEDEVTISQHFGRAPYYTVVTVTDGKIVSKEKRNKAGHHTAGGHDCHEEESCHEGKHGMDAASQTKHAGMLANITDCQVLIAGGMGYGAYESMKSQGIEPIITDVESIDEAVKLYLEGKLVNLMEKLH